MSLQSASYEHPSAYLARLKHSRIVESGDLRRLNRENHPSHATRTLNSLRRTSSVMYGPEIQPLLDRVARTSVLREIHTEAPLRSRKFQSDSRGASSRTEYYQQLSDSLGSIEAHIAYARTKFGDGIETNIKRLSEFSDGLIVLAIDPGLMSKEYFESFIKFLDERVEANPHFSEKSPWEIRQLFSDKMGNSTVYRAIVLPEETARRFKHEGMLSSYYRSTATPGVKRPLSYVHRESQLSIKQAFVQRVNENRSSSYETMQSISYDLTEALKIAAFWAEGRPEQGFVTGFKLSIPRIDIIGTESYMSGKNNSIESLVTPAIYPSEIDGAIRVPFSKRSGPGLGMEMPINISRENTVISRGYECDEAREWLDTFQKTTYWRPWMDM
jgi:hypothetical protein